MGQGKRLFTDHEELLLVEMLEMAAEAAFPYNSDALEASAVNMGKAAYGAKFTLGDRGNWRKGFEKRHAARISKVKSSSICARRAASVTAEVRDKVFEHFLDFVDKLVANGDLTPKQRDNLVNHIINADEVGGDERGKRKRVYEGRKKKEKKWRTTTRDGDHNPFNVTLMLVSMAIGKLFPAISIIHSAPGSKTARMRSDLYENVPGFWHVRRTPTGSMTRELFQDWAVSLCLLVSKHGVLTNMLACHVTTIDNRCQQTLFSVF